MDAFDNPIIPSEAEEDDQFPIGLKVLAIDDDIVCLRYLVQLLQKCQYKVSATTRAEEAIRLINDEKQIFDIVITNVVRHDMDGFKILQIIGVGMDIPVVMISANEDLKMMKRGLMEGAELYLPKPVGLQDLKNIWQLVLRKRLSRKRSNPSLLLLEQPAVEEHRHSLERVTMDQEYYVGDHIVNKLDDDNDNNNIVDSSSCSKKKPRISWTKELHAKFIEAYEILGEKERVPNNILKHMNDPRLTRENVASHLQKHRDTLRKKKESGVGKLGIQKKLYDKNPTKTSTLYNSMNHMNKVSNLGPQFLISNGQGNQTWTAARSCYPVPECKQFNFPSNNSTSRTCDDDNPYYSGGFDEAINNSSYYRNSLETNCDFNSTSQIFVGHYAIENHTDGGAGQCYQMQFNAGNPVESLLMDGELSDIFK